jgi:hypothetical protein
MWLLFVYAVADRSDCHNRLKNPSPLDDPLTSDLNRAEKLFRDDKTVTAFNSQKLMKNLLPLLFAVVVGIACFIPAPASAYRYHGRYYPYSYGGHYYRYRYQGHYYQYQYRGHYYRHRGWVVGVSGRPGYYRYW